MFLKRIWHINPIQLLLVGIIPIASLISDPVFAQPTNLPQLPRPDTPTPTPERPIQLPSPEELLPEVPQPSIPEESPPVLGTIVVKEFKFVGNTAFSAEELAEATKSFTNRPITFAELLKVRTTVGKLYQDNGYVTTGAFIPLQEIKDGIITVQVIEGNLEEIIVTGNKRLNPNYVRSRLAIAGDKPLNQDRLTEGLQILQLDPLIAGISAELSTGIRPGGNILEVQIREARSFHVEIALDNERSPVVGTFRRSSELREDNLFGIGDSIRGAYTNTDGSDDFEVGYTIPFNPRNGTFNIGYRTISSDVIEPGDIDLNGISPDLESEYRQYEIGIRQPIIKTPAQELAIGLRGYHQQSETSLFEIPFPLSVGSDSLGRTRISSLAFFQEWVQRSEDAVIAARSEFDFGLDVIEATINPEPPDGRYFLWRGQAQWVKLLAPDTLFLARANIQVADRALLALQQFGLGGLGTVRGYRQDQILSDNGAFGSVELRFPIFREVEDEIVLQIVPFVDWGTAWNNSDLVELNPNTVVSTGLGLRFEWGDRLTARFDWGYPLIEADTGDNSLQEQGLYFSIIYRPF
jgi:hemolysin activation/secretion protein